MASLDMSTPLPQAGVAAKRPNGLEWVFGMCAFVVYEGAFFPILRAMHGDTGDIADTARSGDLVSRYVQLAVFVVLVLICLGRWRRMVPVFKSIWPIGVFVALCMVSASWSDNPYGVFRKSLALLSCFMFGAYGYEVFGPRRFLMLIAVSSGLASLLSILLYAVAPGLASDTSFLTTRAIRGIYSSKNALSIANQFGLAAALAVLYLEGGLSARGRLFFGFLTLVMLLTLALSRGISSMVNFFFISALIMAFSMRRAQRLRIVLGYLLVCFAALAAFVVIFASDELLQLLDKDASLTGRVPLWAESIRAILQRPLLGYGYMGFWNVDSVRTQYIWSRIGFHAEHAHNAYIELVLDVGIIGAALYLFTLLGIAISAVRQAKYNAPGIHWLLIFMVSVFILNLDEATLALPDEVGVQVAFGACIVGAAQKLRRAA
jgi:exopolysaccharide production protein ExoQ